MNAGHAETGGLVAAGRVAWLGPAAREGAGVLVGGGLVGAAFIAGVHVSWGGTLHEPALSLVLVGATVLGACVRSALGLRARRARGRETRAVQEEMQAVEGAHTRLSAYADQLVATLGQYRAAKAVLVRQIKAVVGSTEEAAKRLVESTRRVDETIRDLIGGLERALTEAEGRDQEGTGKRQAVRNAIGVMRRYIDARSGDLALDRERVEAVRRRADDLSRLACLVEDLADRTKVLAINASIEAARAGDRGRAFAVVASEVHNLAQQSARAAVEISQGLSAVRRAIHEQFAAKLDPEKEAEERRLLEFFADALGEIDERSAALERIHRGVLAEAREHGRRVAETVMETFAGLQFQDVVRQRLDQVVDALDRMIRHTEALLESAWEPEGPFPEPFGVEEMFGAYRMEPQRTAHREALGQEGTPEGAPAVELF